MPDEASVELLRSLAVLVEPPTSEHEALVRALGLTGSVSPGSYADVFAFQLYPYASVYLGAEGMLGGEARDRVAGLWRALGQDPPAEPDHLAALLGLYARLGDVLADTGAAERALLVEGQRTLLGEHLAPWIFGWLARVVELAPEPYRGWADVLGAVLRAEVGRLDIGSGRVPEALTSVGQVRDPRSEGSEAFLRDLLAHARSGIVLTRADLARVAGTLDLGLRAGERRYALEHLLAQSPEGVLKGIGALALRQAEAHDERRTWLGGPAEHFAGRARAVNRLVLDLAESADEPAEVTP